MTIEELADRQHGVFTLVQALEAGAARRTIDRRLASGAWVSLNCCVYRLSGTGRTWEQRLMGPVLASGPTAAASHRSAAALLRIPGFDRSRLEVTSPRPRRHREAAGIVHRWRPFPPHHLTVVEGIVTTGVARTLVDLAGVLQAGRTERAVDNCLARGMVSLTMLQDVFNELAGRGRRGIALMRELLDERGDGHVAPESELERRFLALIRAAGLPEPVRQHHVVTIGLGLAGSISPIPRPA